jgi:hypothetical protein
MSFLSSLFGRRKAGRHELGAAVTGIPALPVARVVPASYGAFAPAPVEAFVAPVPLQDEPPVAVVPVQAPVAPAPRVELGFRDGSTAALSPESAQAKALTEIASVLTQRD